MHRLLFLMWALWALLQGASVTFGEVQLRMLEAKTFVTIECLSQSDISIRFNDLYNKTRIIAECETSSLKACYLREQSLGNNYAVFYTGFGAIFNIVKDNNETLGTYTFCETYNNTMKCVTSEIQSHSTNTTRPRPEQDRTYDGTGGVNANKTMQSTESASTTLQAVILVVILLFIIGVCIRFVVKEKKRLPCSCFSKRSKNSMPPTVSDVDGDNRVQGLIQGLQQQITKQHFEILNMIRAPMSLKELSTLGDNEEAYPSVITRRIMNGATKLRNRDTNDMEADIEQYTVYNERCTSSDTLKALAAPSDDSGAFGIDVAESMPMLDISYGEFAGNVIENSSGV